MTTDTYNGWTNRETWAAHLWLTNNHDYLGLNKPDGKWLEALVRDLESECFEGRNEDATNVIVNRETLSGLLSIGSLWRVNWNEIAKALNEG